jgi:hypothetical protein
VPTWTIVLSIAGSVVTGGYGLVRYRMRLRFLRETFDRNGDRRDLEVAGRVTSPGWMQLVGGKGQARDDPDAATEPDPIQRVLGPSPSTPT